MKSILLAISVLTTMSCRAEDRNEASLNNPTVEPIAKETEVKSDIAEANIVLETTASTTDTVEPESTTEKDESLKSTKIEKPKKPVQGAVKFVPTEQAVEEGLLPDEEAVIAEPEEMTIEEPYKASDKANIGEKPKQENAKTQDVLNKELITPKEEEKTATEDVLAELHDTWDKLLSKYVNNQGGVNYAGMKSEKAKLNAYLQTLGENAPSSDWSKEKTMAYWINVYNAATVKLIVDNYPASSIMDLDGGKTWDVKRINIGGKSYSLNNVEHDILRAKYKDARIHFAVNCAAQSCPKLHNEAWTAENLESNLENLTREFINNKAANQISSQSLQLSKIFEWYAGDFGDITAYIDRYTDVDVSSKAKVSYNDYDWALNKQ